MAVVQSFSQPRPNFIPAQPAAQIQNMYTLFSQNRLNRVVNIFFCLSLHVCPIKANFRRSGAKNKTGPKCSIFPIFLSKQLKCSIFTLVAGRCTSTKAHRNSCSYFSQAFSNATPTISRKTKAQKHIHTRFSEIWVNWGLNIFFAPCLMFAPLRLKKKC